MSNHQHWDRLISLMEEEGDLLDDFNDMSSRLREALHSQDWITLEDALVEMNKQSKRISAIEDKRITLVRCIEGEESIQKSAARLEPELRKRFNRIYSELKSRFTIAESRNRGIAQYADSRGRLVRDLVEELFPSSRGRMYNQKGQSALAGGDPMILFRNI